MEEEDPVVQEIPVYLSQALADNLYLYQYPVMPANRAWNDVKVLNASVKPRNQIVRLEVGLDTNSDKYCVSKGEQIALNTDGSQESRFIRDKERERSMYFRNGVMDKIVYESSSPCLESQHYAVAILQDKELHCTPLKGIVQMRPAYSYYDRQEKRKHDKNKAEDSEDDEKEPEAQQIRVKFARQETEVAKKAREKSYETISQRVAEEPWFDALWKHSNTDHAELERYKLFSATSGEGSALAARARHYVRALVPPPDQPAPTAPTTTTTATTTLTTQDYIKERIKEILINAKLMRFSELLAAVRSEGGVGVGADGVGVGVGGAGEGVCEGALLAALCAAACCVRGLWAARSADLYAHPAHPAHPAHTPASTPHAAPALAPAPAAPVPARLLCAARDHILYLFTQQSYVERRKVTASVRLPDDVVLEIISSVAKLNPRLNGWELLLPPDLAFEAKYPDVVQRQNMHWEARQRMFNEMLIGENVPKRQRKKSQRDSVGSDAMMSPKPRCNSVSEDDGDRKRHKNKSATGSGKRTRNISSSSAHDGT